MRFSKKSEPKKTGTIPKVRKARTGKLAILLADMWDRRPKWPGWKKLFGPGLLILGLGLLVAEGLILSALTPSRTGKEIPLSEVYRAARGCRVESATFLDQDALILLHVYDAVPGAPPPPVPIGVEQSALPVCAQTPAQLAQAQAQAAQQAAQPSKDEAPPEAEPTVPPPAVEVPEAKPYWSTYPSSDAETTVIVQELFNGGALFDFDPQVAKGRLRFVAQFIIPLLVLATIFSLFFLIITSGGSGAADFLGFSKFASKVQRRRKMAGAVTFKDVAAIDEGITELQEVVDYLQSPQKFADLGARAPKGVLLVGPPGTGKTLLARAVAGEASVPFIQLSGSEFVESLVGVGAARVRDLFKQARELAPCIIFIDELDAAGRQRGAGMGQGNDEREQTLNQLLVEMDGFATALGVAVLGATNRPDILDPALLRPGRFDRQVVIDVPDVRGRDEILRVHARSRPMAADVDLLQIAKETPGFTGAELANILNEAALLAVRRSGGEITQSEMEEAVDRVIAGPERRSHILTDEEKILIAYHEAGHAVVARGAGQDTGVLKLSIIARGLQLGHASTYSSADRLILLRSELEGQITTLLGGLAAEKLLFGELSTGNAKDLEKATTLARKLVATYGMTDEVGRLQVLHEGQVFMGRDFAAAQHTSMKTLDAVDEQVRRILDEAEARAVEICETNRDIMDEIVQRLLVDETMTGPELDPYLDRVRRLDLPKPYAAMTNLLENGGIGKTKKRRGAASHSPVETLSQE